MTYYYIKNGGTATGTNGTSSSPRTGSWSSMNANTYYNTVKSALTASAPSDGDTFLISNANNYTFSYSVVQEQVYIQTDARVGLISVSDTDVTTPSPGALYRFTYTSNDYGPDVHWNFEYMYGIKFDVYYSGTGGVYEHDWVTLKMWDLYNGSNSPNNLIYKPRIAELCEFTHSVDKEYANRCEGPHPIQHISYGDILYKKCKFDIKSLSTYDGNVIPIYNYRVYSDLDFIDCTFHANSSPSGYPDIYSILGHSVCLGADTTSSSTFTACDFSDALRAIYYADDARGTESRFIIVDRCKLNTYSYGGSGFDISGKYFPNVRLNSQVGTNTTWESHMSHYYYTLTSTTSVYTSNSLNASKYPDASAFSLKLVTYPLSTVYSNTGPVGIRIKIGEFWVKNFTGQRQFTVFFARDNGATALNENQVWIELVYGGVTNPKGGRIASHGFVQYGTVDHTPKTLKNSGVTWTGLTNPTRQQVSLKTSGFTEPALVSIYLYYTQALSTIYIDPYIEVG